VIVEYSFELTGSYDGAYIIGAILTVIAWLLIMTLKPLNEKQKLLLKEQI